DRIAQQPPAIGADSLENLKPCARLCIGVEGFCVDSMDGVEQGGWTMIRFADARNIVVTGTIISYTPKPKGQSGPPDSNEMQVDGYETDVMLLLSRLRWSWTGWALIKDIWRTHKTMLVIPWNELPYLDSRGWQGFNAT